MGMIGRLKRILKAVVADIVEKARDPELELARFVEEVEMSLGEVRTEAEEVRLRRDRLARLAAENQVAAEEWMAKAESAAGRDEDDVAREALRRHHEAHDEMESCRERMNQAEEALRTLQEDETALRRKLAEAREERKRLTARLRRAESEKHAGAALADADRPSEAADRVREEILDMQSEGEATRQVHAESIEAQFAQIDAGPSLEEELTALKERVKKRPDAEDTKQ